MAKALFLPAAEADLDAIWLYVGRDSPARADRLLDQIREGCRLLAEFPEMGRLQERFAPGLRRFPISSYLVFYRPLAAGEGVEVVRVLHQRRDIQRSLEGT